MPAVLMLDLDQSKFLQEKKEEARKEKKPTIPHHNLGLQLFLIGAFPVELEGSSDLADKTPTCTVYPARLLYLNKFKYLNRARAYVYVRACPTTAELSPPPQERPLPGSAASPAGYGGDVGSRATRKTRADRVRPHAIKERGNFYAGDQRVRRARYLPAKQENTTRGRCSACA